MEVRVMQQRQTKKVLGSLLIMVAWLAISTASAYAQNTVTTVTLIMTDTQGNVLMTTDVHGNILARYTYRPYGTQQNGPTNAGPGYTGHVHDPETGLIYMQQRYYDPETQHFISVDPIAPTPGNIYNFNRYAYANNNPMTYIDPTGTTCRRVKDGYKCKVDNNSAKFTKNEIKRINDAYTDAVNQLLSHPFRTVTVSLRGILFKVSSSQVANALISATVKTGRGVPKARAATYGGLAKKYIDIKNHGNPITTIYHNALEKNRNGRYFINVNRDLKRTFGHEGIHETSSDAFMAPLFKQGKGPFNSIHNSVYNQAGDTLLKQYGPVYAPTGQ